MREVLKAEGFPPLPRRLDEERPQQPRPTVEPVAMSECCYRQRKTSRDQVSPPSALADPLASDLMEKRIVVPGGMDYPYA